MDNVGDSGDDSEDEWNYYKGDTSSQPDKEVNFPQFFHTLEDQQLKVNFLVYQVTFHLTFPFFWENIII